MTTRRKSNWRRVAVVTAIAFFSLVGVHTIAVNTYNIAAMVMYEISLRLPQQDEEKTVVSFSHHVRVVTTHDCHLLELIQKQGFFYQEALILSDKVREDNNLSSCFVKKGTTLLLPTRE